MAADRIDIMQELADLYQQEEMLAFFEFRLDRPGAAAAAGLCRISRPKSSAQTPYLSLTFMVDAPDDATRAAVDAALAPLEGAAFKVALPTIAEVVPMPAMTQGSENDVRQIDLMLHDDAEPARRFIEQRLLPAVRALTPLTVTEVVWWGDAA